MVTEAVLLAAGFAIGREYLASIRKLIVREQIRESMERVGLDPDSRKKVGKYSLFKNSDRAQLYTTQGSGALRPAGERPADSG